MIRPLLPAVFLLACCLPLAAQEEALPLPRALPEPAPAPPPAVPAAPLPPVAPLPAAGRPAFSSTSSTSTSGQFIVHGSELRVRGGLAARCEEINQELSRLLRSNDPWVLNIVVQVRPPSPADPPDIGITSQVSGLESGGFHLQITIPERAGLRPADFRRELVGLLLAERILRDHKQLASKREQLLPAWVHTGVLKALDFKQRARPSAEFAAIFKSGRIYGIEEILDTVPAGLDGLSRTIYETSCCALVLALLDQPEGPLRFGRFLSSLAVETKPERELLRHWFPGLAESDTSLNKWWSLQLAQLASPGLAETLDPVASAELLDRALTFHLPRIDKKQPAPRAVAAIAAQRPKSAPEPEVALKSAPPPEPSVKKTASASKPAVKTVSSRPQNVPAAPKTSPAGTTAEEEEKEDRPGFLRRIFSFGTAGADKDKDEDEPAQEPAAPRKETAAKPREKEDEPPAETKTPTDEPAKNTAQAAPKPESKSPAAREEQKPQTSETEADKPEGGRFNPFKWFRGGKKSEEPPPASEPAKEAAKKSAGLPAPAARSLIVRDLLGNPRGRYIQAAAGDRPDLLELPVLAAPPPAAQAAPELIAYPIEDYALILAHPERKRLLDQARLALKDLIVRGNVLFREIGKDYLKVLDDLDAGKTKGMDERLASLRRKAVETLAKACAVQDHLDWYEATRSERASGLFDDYLTLPERIDEERPPREDPLSRHLDEVERRYGR